MIGSGSLGRGSFAKSTPRKPALGGRWTTPLLAVLAASAFAIPFTIVEQTADAGGKPGSRGSIVLSESAPVIPGNLDLILVVDRSSSYEDDLPNMADLVPGALAQMRGDSDLRVGVASFIDGTASDPGFRLDRELSSDIGGIGDVLRSLPIGDRPNDDWPEMALSALVRSIDAFEFRDEAQVVALVTTDADSKEPAGHRADEVGRIFADRGIRVVSIFATQVDRGPFGFGAGSNPTFERQGRILGELTGGSVQELSSTDSSDIDRAILAGLQNLPVAMTPRIRPGCPLDELAISPDGLSGAVGGREYAFELSYRIAENAPLGSSLCAIDLGGNADQQFELRVEG